LYTIAYPPTTLPTNNYTEQTVWVQIHGTNNQPSLLLCSVYINPDSTTHLQLLSHQLTTAKQTSPRILIGGDFNAKHQLWGSPPRSFASNPAYKRGEHTINFATNHQLFILNDGSPTYQHPTGIQSHIDLTLATPQLHPNITNWSVQQQHNVGTDHDPILMFINFDTTTENDQPRATWNFQGNWTEYQHQLEIQLNRWSQQLDHNQPINTIYEQFTNAIHQAAHNSIGTKVTKHKPKPWWKKSLNKYVYTARKHYRKWRKTKKPADRIQWQQSNAVKRKAINTAKKVYTNQLSKQLNTSTPTTFWKQWSKITKTPATKKLPILQHNNQHITNIETKLELLNNNFIKPPQHPPQLDHQFHQQIETYITNIDNDDMKSPLNQTNLNAPITINEIQQATKRLKNNKAMGPDNIHNQLITNGGPIMHQSLQQLFNISLNQGILPTQWKMANICAIPKPSRDPTKVTNYRPISLLSCVGKLMERVLSFRLTNYLQQHQLITKHQHGFQPNKRTTDLLTYFVESIYKSFDLKSATHAAFLDISKAYDSVWRNGLIFKLHQQFHLRGKLYKWLTDFLQNRWCRVHNNQHYSTWQQPTVGVPQGAVLSPILFIMYINDIPSTITNTTRIGMFADDIALWTPPEPKYSLTRITNNLQQDLDNIFSWSTKWKLLFNPNKCSIITFTKLRTVPPPNLQLNNTQIPTTTDSAKYLGIWFDPKLTWNQHITKTKLKATKRILQLSQFTGINWGITYKTILHLYKTIVLPILDYGCFLWDGSKHTSKLNTIQNKAIQLATGSFCTTPTESNNILAALLPLDIRRIKFSTQNLARAMRAPATNHLHTSWINWLTYHPPNQNWNTKYKHSINSPLTRAFKYAKQLQLPDIQCHPTIEPSFWEPTHFNTIKLTPQLQREHQQNKNQLIVFTDGSCHPNPGTASIGVYSPGTSTIPTYNQSKLIGKRISIDTCELQAIQSALQLIYIKHYYLRTPHISIFSDSQFCVKLCNNEFKPKYWIHANLCHQIINTINNIQPTTVSITKIKAHNNNFGNEMADELANQAQHQHYQIQHLPKNTNVPYTIAKTEINTATHKYWQQRWNHPTTKGRSFWHQQPTIPTHIDQHLSQLSKSDCSLITRLRTTHIPLKHHLQTHMHQTNGLCDQCNQQETIQHFLLQCPKYQQHRQAMLHHINKIHPTFSNQLPITISNLLYPSTNISTAKQLQILQTVAFYCKQTERFSPPYYVPTTT